MSNENNESPAFPIVIDDASKNQFTSTGLTILEYFSLHLMSAIVSNGNAKMNYQDKIDGDDNVRASKVSIGLAKALLKELEANK